MKIVLAPDSFKECMTSIEACNCMEKALKESGKDIEIIKIPIADGGEGTLDSLILAKGGKIFKKVIRGPLGEKVIGRYGILKDGKTGVIEVAEACGLSLIPKEKRNPMYTNTFGVGELIKELLDKNIEKIIIGLGGSSTNDGGIGMVTALGGKFFDVNKNEINPIGKELINIDYIDITKLDKRLSNVEFIIACDVTNPLVGELGASKIFAKQKGANEEEIELLEKGLNNLGNIIKNQFGKYVLNIEGGGAAGGLGIAFMFFMNAKLKSGIDIILKETNFEEVIKNSDYIFTGEGKIDSQTINGKTISGISKCSKKYNIPVICFVGKAEGDIKKLYYIGIKDIIVISKKTDTLEMSLKNGKKNLIEKVKKFIYKI
ncbi:glycerate kinase [Clostridium thermobutyricum]|uniref:Glycerate kinase n=1 Tax=Clostridium thermobutyricum TaxID=29372 RepID=N9Y2Q8_9CLOT|nr:glycerate kinase [Clostridium thermobutyricum]ENZ02102.1 glycerate kinase [Clostridium thermobutyricum]